MTTLQKQLFVAFLAFAISSCAAFTPTEKPTTLEERLGVASLTLTGVYRTHAQLNQSGRVTKEIDSEMVTIEATIEQAISVARVAIKAGDVKTAEGQLKLMQLSLLALNQRITQLQAQEAQK